MVEPRGPLGLPRCRNGRRLFVARIRPASENPDAAPMGRQVLDVKDPQVVTREHPLDHSERQVRIVLVIDRIELDLGDHPQQMRKLEGRHPLGIEDRGKPRDEIVDLRHMRKHVISGSEVGGMALAREA